MPAVAWCLELGLAVETKPQFLGLAMLELVQELVMQEMHVVLVLLAALPAPVAIL